MADVSSDKVTGIVKWFNEEKGYGFIKLLDGSREIFVHVNQLKKSGIVRSLNEGEKVGFLIDQGPKGTYAKDLKILNEPASQGSTQ